MAKVRLQAWKCERCGHQWIPRSSKIPTVCPKCKSPYWSRPTGDKSHASRKPSWQEPVREIIGKVDTETLNLKRDELKKADEREAQRELAGRLIDIGYKVLAHKLHPDKGGSREAMVRLNAVRDRLK